MLTKLERRFPDDWPLAEIVRQVHDDALLLWLVQDDDGEALAVIGTQRLVKPSGAIVLSVTLAAGREARKWIGAVRTRLEEHARQNGCHRIEIEQRPGWARYLPDYAVTKRTVLTKEVA